MKRSLVRFSIGCSICVVALLASVSTALAIDEYSAPGGPSGITVGRDGALWFTEETGNKIGRMTTGGAVTNEIPIPTPASGPGEITVGPDNKIWFTEFDGNKIGRVDSTTTICEFPVPGGGNPDGIVAGPDGALWFTQFSSNQIGRIPVTATCGSGSSITEYGPTGSGPGDIALGPDGGLWFTESVANNIRRIDPNSPSITPPFPVPNGGDPGGITASTSGLWFTQSSSSEIGKITTSGTITEFGPTGPDPSTIAIGPDQALWFTESAGDAIGRIATNGAITNRFALAPGSEPSGITAGPDSALWFTEKLGNRIGRIAVAPPFVPPPPPPPAPPVSTKKKCKVPKLKNLTVKKARSKLKKAGCKYRIRGKGRVRSTSPRAGRTTTGKVTVKCKAKRKKAKRSTHLASLAGAQAAADAATHAGYDLADHPHVSAVGVRHSARNPRRTNRRLRTPGGDRTHSALARDGTRAAAVTSVELDGNRRRTKRALMRRLISVRGGLQA